MGEDEMPEELQPKGQLMREASLWFARMRGPDAESYRAEFEHWLALGASHRGAYNYAGEIFAMGRFLAAEEDAAQGEANDNENTGYRWKWVALAASLLIVVGVGGWFTGFPLSGGKDAAVQSASPVNGAIVNERYAAASGSRKSVRLVDGSVIELEAGSEVVASFGPARREVRLERGRARFDVAHDGRPFVVLAGGGIVTARGTVFDVILGKDHRVTVRLLQGAVDVERPVGVKGSTGPVAVARLEPGEVLSFAVATTAVLPKTTGKAELQQIAPNPELPLVREYERTPLSAVIAEANRDSSTSIRLADPSIGALRVSGRFRVDDADQVADRLATLFDLEVEKTKPNEITLRQR
ncbi:FecR family protein [Sphingobium sp. BS19]|uniref:FecR family protein n=1 Tax=Sphingobium sp. BS19 TaxID=3018973 RepID=UPI0022EFA22D|nr:FecR domain-containing protein [Sphingobium sp. BS19]GLJ00212.1 iron dicitrate transporter FecR [Sphingobium sp. BS19]